MTVVVRDNNNIATPYIFEPNGPSRLAEVIKFYQDAYRNLRIRGFKVYGENGEVLASGGSI